MPAKRSTAFRSHRKPKRRSSAPTMPFSRCSGTTVTRVTPSVPMTSARVMTARTVPTSGARQPRVTPTASTMVVASTNSTALAMNAGAADTLIPARDLLVLGADLLGFFVGEVLAEGFELDLLLEVHLAVLDDLGVVARGLIDELRHELVGLLLGDATDR